MSVAWSFGAQLVAFFCSRILQESFHNLGISGCHNTLILSSPHLCLIRVFILDFPMLCIDGLENLHVDQMFQTTADSKGEGSDPVKHV